MPLFRYKNIQKIRHKRCKKKLKDGILKEILRAKNKREM